MADELVRALQMLKKDWIEPPVMTSKVEKDNSWLHNELWKEGFLNKGMQKLNLDSKRFACSQQEFVNWIKWDWTNQRKWLAEEYDCDNFAFSFKARTDRRLGINCVGLVIDYSGGHAYNVVAFSDARAKLYEPQRDRWGVPGQSKSASEMYKLESGYIII